jgi:putative addiction module killer protein
MVLWYLTSPDMSGKSVGISELRIPHGPGYRVYCKQTDWTIILILCGGDKATQAKDIERAKAMVAEIARS